MTETAPANRMRIPHWCLCAGLVLAAHLAIALPMLAKKTRGPASPKPRDAILISLAARSTPMQYGNVQQSHETARITPKPEPETELKTPSVEETAKSNPPRREEARGPHEKANTATKAGVQSEPKPERQAEQQSTAPASQPPDIPKARPHRDARTEAETQKTAAHSPPASSSPPVEASVRSKSEQKAASSAARKSTAKTESREVMRTWQRKLQRYLAQYKQYPRRALLRHREGTVHLHFVINRKGKVLSWRIRQSSGSRALDREAQAMLQRAEALPPPPPQVAQSRIALNVPIHFALR